MQTPNTKNDQFETNGHLPESDTAVLVLVVSFESFITLSIIRMQIMKNMSPHTM